MNMDLIGLHTAVKRSTGNSDALYVCGRACVVHVRSVCKAYICV